MNIPTIQNTRLQSAFLIRTSKLDIDPSVRTLNKNQSTHGLLFLVGLAVGVPCNSDGVCTSNELHCADGYVKGCHSGLCTCEHATCKKFPNCR